MFININCFIHFIQYLGMFPYFWKDAKGKYELSIPLLLWCIVTKIFTLASVLMYTVPFVKRMPHNTIGDKAYAISIMVFYCGYNYALFVVVVVCIGARDHYLRSAMQLGTPKVQILSPPLGVLGIF